MELPIARFDGSDVLRAARRCRMDLSRSIADEFAADGSFAFASQSFPALPSANCVELDESLDVARFAAINAAFAARGRHCLRWTAPAADPLLLKRGASVATVHVMRLQGRPSAGAAGQSHPAVMILQARSATSKLQNLLEQRFAGEASGIAAAMLQADDPHDEWLIAIEAGRATAAAGVLINGDAGLIHDAFAPSAAAGAAVIDRLIEFAGRAGLRHVLACAGDADAQYFQAAGFVRAAKVFDHVVAPLSGEVRA